MMRHLFFLGVFLFSFTNLFSQNINNSDNLVYPLTSLEGLELVNVKAEVVEHLGKMGLRITKSNDSVATKNLETLVLISDINFENGTIEVELAGEPAKEASAQSRGFVGIAFRLKQEEDFNYECFYIRPTNSRAENQVRRNHSVQYISHPDFPWYRLRKESPKLYETYVDLVPSEWTKLKIVVSGNKAKLFIHNSKQPTLIVNDLKKGNSTGQIALWLHSSTLAHFRNLVISPEDNLKD